MLLTGLMVLLVALTLMLSALLPDPMLLAFQTYDRRIFLLDARNKLRVKLIDNGDQMAWSPDGRQLAYVSHAQSVPQIVLYDLQTDTETWLTDSIDMKTDPTWSPDGTALIYAVQPQNNQVLDINHRVQPSTTFPGIMRIGITDDLPELVFPPRRGIAIGQPGMDSLSWSPNGETILFSGLFFPGSYASYPMIYLTDVSTHEFTTLSFEKAYDSGGAWSPNGDQIAFISARTGRQAIYLMNADNTNTQMISEPGLSASAPSWSPDGSHLAFFVMPQKGDPQLGLFTAETGLKLRSLQTLGEFFLGNPEWSSDGDWLAMILVRKSARSIYLTSQSGQTWRVLTDSEIMSLAWRP